MFESDDWIFEDTFDIDEKTIQSHSRCQNEEEASSVKRRKVDNCKVLFSPTDNTLNSNVDVATEDSNSSRNNKNNVSRGDLLLEIFQENTSQKIFNLEKEISNPLNDIQKETQDLSLCKTNTLHYKKNASKEKNRTESVNKIELGKEVKLVRIFPGPAGLVPDVKNDNIPVVSYLNRVKELENKTAIKHIEIKSQDEKNSFGEKAWKFLLDDVSVNLFEQYRISIIKKKANANHCNSMKVKFLAGILDYIDHSHDDPFIILKDSTDSLEGTIHRDILLKYPGILEPNVVILLHDVGLLKTTTYVITNKYHILVSQVNLLAIYSDKGRIVSASHMENILSNVELNRDYSMSVSKQYVSRLQGIYENCDKISSQTNFSINNKSIKDYEPTLINDPILRECDADTENRKDEIFESPNYSMNMNNLNMNNIFLTSDCEFITLKEQNCLNSDNISHNNKIPQCELQARNMNHLENARKESIINSENKIRKEHLSQSLQKCVADVTIFNAHYSRESCFSSGIAHEARKNSNLNIKSTLSGIKRNSDNSRILVSYFTDANEYDSDDEILSQLDVDNICSDSKKKC
ncbi:metacaspase-3 isoform X2 [Polyergus mexicanus]|uniref:metacaspase-3 isoform X2 n=1 Tax=Polyergus mexicanus TaxID=615972 RepID=UPI0038B4BA22